MTSCRTACDLQASEDRHEEVVEVVCESAGQLPDRLHFLRLEDRFLRRPLLTDVARDLREADQFALGVPDRVDDDVRPEARTVLSQTPSLALEAPFFLRKPKGKCRQAALSIFVGVERGEVSTDDLLLLVTFETLGAWVPARDEAARVEHVDGVVGNGLDEQAVALLVPDFGIVHDASPSVATDSLENIYWKRLNPPRTNV